MSEIGSPQPEIPEEAVEKEAEGIRIATEISELRASARNEADYENILQKTRELKELFGIVVEGKLSGEVAEQMSMAKEIMEEDFFGPDEIKKALGIEVTEMPDIPFKKEELERAKELEQILILRTDKASDGSPLTMEKVRDMMGNEDKDGGKIFWESADWYKDEAFYTKETAKVGWALVSKEEIPDATNKNYLEQTESLVTYLKNQVFAGKPMPKEYQDAVGEFESQKSTIESLVEDDWKAAAEKLSKLSITKLTRQSPVEAIYDIVVHYQNTDERLLEEMYTWTSARDSGGRLVHVGGFGAEGVNVNGSSPDSRYDFLGVSFSRSQ